MRASKIFSVALAFTLIVTFWAAVTHGWPFHGGGAPPSTPTLQAVADSFGDSTPSGRGAVFLNSQDQNFGTGVTTSGLDILISGTCAKWSTAVTGGTSSHWNVISHIADASAKTPTPTAAGVSAKLNGGPYTFQVSCEDSSNNVLATANLTRTIVTNAVNLGTGESTSGAWPGTFGNTAGAKMMYSTGYYKPTGRTFWIFGGTNQTLWTNADPARPATVNQIEFGSASHNITVQDIILTGASITGNNAALILNGTQNMNIENVHAYYSASIIGNSQFGFASLGPNGTVDNFSCDWCATGMAVGSNYVITNGYFRYFNNNGIFFINLHDTEIDDLTLVSPVTNALSQHPDCMQRADGSSQIRLVVKRTMCVGADAASTAQGPWFGGAVVGAAGDALGYVSAGCGNTNPGKVLCLTSTGVLASGSNGSVIYSPTGSPLGASDLVTLSCTPASNCQGDRTATLSLASDINYGSAASPVTFYGLQNIDNTWDQIAYSANTFNGMVTGSESGTSSLSRFAYIEQEYPGSSAAGVGFVLANCEVSQVHLGSFTISGGLIYEGIGTRKAVPITPNTPCSPNVPPANTTVTNVTQAAGSGATLVSAYTAGNPKTNLEAISAATYAGMTVAQIKGTYCHYMAAKPSGPLDGGGGTWYNPFIAGGWADGTAIAGC